MPTNNHSKDPEVLETDTTIDYSDTHALWEEDMFEVEPHSQVNGSRWAVQEIAGLTANFLDPDLIYDDNNGRDPSHDDKNNNGGH